MNIVLSTISSEAKPWSATINAELEENHIKIKLKRTYDHYKNLSANKEAIMVDNGVQESIIKAIYSSEVDIGGGISEVILEPYWIRVVKEGLVKDFTDPEDVKREVISSFS